MIPFCALFFPVSRYSVHTNLFATALFVLVQIMCAPDPLTRYAFECLVDRSAPQICWICGLLPPFVLLDTDAKYRDYIYILKNLGFKWLILLDCSVVRAKAPLQIASLFLFIFLCVSVPQ